MNPEYLIALYNQLRDPTGQNVNEATEKLKNFLQVPQSIVCLFEVVSKFQEPIIRSIAANNVKDYLLIHKGNIAPDILANVRKVLIQCLVNEQSSQVRLQIINDISILINFFPGDWPELEQFLFTDNFLQFLPSILKILISLFPKLSNENISTRIQYFINLILAGLQSPDLNCNCYAVSFFYSIMIKVNDASKFAVFKEPLFQLFQNVVKTQDVQMLTQFLEPISIGMNNNIIFLPTNQVLPFLISILVSDVEIDFKSPINNLLSLYLQFETEQISIEILQQIFDLETRLAIQLYDLSMDDPTLSWLQDCQSVFEGIYMRIPEETVVKMAVTRFKQLVEQKQPQFLLSAISVLTSAITLLPKNFEESIPTIFPQLLSFLGTPDKYVQKFVSDSISNICSEFADFITDNLKAIVQAVVFFIQQTAGTEGIHLLSSIMRNTNFSDDVFPSLLPPVLEWMRHPDQHVKQDAALILGSMIVTSHQQVPYFANQIATTVISLLKESLELHYSCYIVITSLCYWASELMAPYVGELVPIVVAGIHSPDVSVKSEAIKTISELPKVICYGQNFQNDFKTIVSEALSIANAEIQEPADDQIYSLSGQAAFQASILVSMMSNDSSCSLLPPVLAAVLHVARLPSMNCLSCAAQGFFYLAPKTALSQGDIDAVTNPTEEMTMLLIERLTDSSRYDMNILCDIITAIAKVIETSGVVILKHKELELITILSSVLTQTMNPYTGALFCTDEILLPISNIFISLSFSTEENNKQILQALLPMLSNLLNHKSYQYQVFSITIFAQLLSRNSTLMQIADQMKFELISNMLNRIAESVPNVASAAARFIYQLCINEESVPLLEKCVVPALTALMTRLQKVTNLTSENISMRENILLAIAAIGVHILKEKFPMNEALPVVLKALPIIKEFECCNEVYLFLNSISFMVPPELQIEYIRIYTSVIARPESHLEQMYIKMYILVNMVTILDRFLSSFNQEQQKEMIARVLNNDAYKLKCFADQFEAIKKTAATINMG